MEVQDADEPPSRASSRPMAARVTVDPSTPLGLSGRQRSSSLDNERSWRPASGFASKHKAELEAKRLHRERQMQRARHIQQMQEEKKRREAELSKGPKPNDHVIVEDGEWKTVVSHGRRARNDRRTTQATTSIFIPLPPGPPTLGISHSLGGPPVSAALSTGRSLSQDEMESADVVRRKRRQQMKRRQKTPSQRAEAKLATVDGVPHPSLLGEVMFQRRSSLQRLVDNLHVDEAVDKVAEFSVTDFEMATKISQFVLDLFGPPKEKDDTTLESGNENQENGSSTTEQRRKYPLVVTDGTACVGGNVLSFCDFFTHVNAIENDSTRVQMLRHNLQILHKTNAKCIHANYLDVMLELQQDVVFLDPPWGGPEYKDLDKVDLFLGGLPLHEVCTRLQGSAKCIVLKVPSNFDDVKFSQHVPGKVMIRRDLKKMHLVLLDFR
ncbi:S-adenosyl-L-methionine-dependent methyltransferase [Phytophthora palmivora]|uniref:Trimethylguanosine synthase n=1 Tax=Phytophthora palmivora TaxID=4796 RepID=A0A2P4XI13_9STRA|nr:S-adenosyl-L-methionine-dependent methyltransferase [Phytophthora palmivora]